ncbi:MAG: EamA family transporter, partial [Lentisphaeria bacterium]|nr:EamA family transporter [Lentisphaeria bacterium]
ILKTCAQDISSPLRSLTYYSTRGLALSSTLWLICLLFKANRQDLLAFRDRKQLKQGMLAGIFASFSYLLVLCAMNYVTNVSYVQVFRQLGLPIGMGLGVLILKERCTLIKVIGMVLILVGLAVSVLV